jgi:hypothetical protein
MPRVPEAKALSLSKKVNTKKIQLMPRVTEANALSLKKRVNTNKKYR